MTHFTGVIISRKRNTTVLAPLWTGSVKRSNRAKALPMIHENNQYRSTETAICICTCVGCKLAQFTTIGNMPWNGSDFMPYSVMKEKLE